MPIQVHPSSGRGRAAVLKEMNLCIAKAEVSSCAQADAIRVLARTGYDTTEAVRVLYVDMDALAAMRVVRSGLQDAGVGSKQA